MRSKKPAAEIQAWIFLLKLSFSQVHTARVH